MSGKRKMMPYNNLMKRNKDTCRNCLYTTSLTELRIFDTGKNFKKDSKYLKWSNNAQENLQKQKFTGKKDS